jgi:hypothetical protein
MPIAASVTTGRDSLFKEGLLKRIEDAKIEAKSASESQEWSKDLDDVEDEAERERQKSQQLYKSMIEKTWGERKKGRKEGCFI